MRRVATPAFLATLMLGGGWAAAGFSGVAASSASFGTGVVGAPTGVTAQPSCKGRKIRAVTVAWTAPASPLVSGYRVERGLLGVYTVVASVSSTTATFDDLTPPVAGVVTYRVVTTYNTWSSAPSATASVSTLC